MANIIFIAVSLLCLCLCIRYFITGFIWGSGRQFRRFVLDIIIIIAAFFLKDRLAGELVNHIGLPLALLKALSLLFLIWLMYMFFLITGIITALNGSYFRQGFTSGMIGAFIGLMRGALISIVIMFCVLKSGLFSQETLQSYIDAVKTQVKNTAMKAKLGEDITDKFMNKLKDMEDKLLEDS